MIRAVLDANVFVSSVLAPHGIPARILDAWRQGQFRLFMSEAILDEVDRVLHYPRIVRRHHWSDEEISVFIDDLTYLATLTPGKLTLSVIKEDPSDDRYLECAIEGEVDYIVSGDQHLLELGEYERIPILKPRAFLEHLTTK